jgi:hypothetical protein
VSLDAEASAFETLRGPGQLPQADALAKMTPLPLTIGAHPLYTDMVRSSDKRM